MAVNDTIKEFLNNVKNDIINEQKNKSFYLTGVSARSLRIVQTRARSGQFGTGYTLTAQPYLLTNFEGIGAKTKSFPAYKKGSKLFKWVTQRKPNFLRRNRKGQFTGKMKPAAISFLIARSIKEKGTKVYQGTRAGIDLQEIINNNTTELTEGLAQDLAFEVTKNLNQAILR